MRLDRAAFLAKAALKREDVDLPELGTVSVRQLSAGEVGEYVKLQKAEAEELDMLAWLFVRVVVDEAGKPLFGDADLPAVKGMALPVLTQLAKAATKLSGLEADKDAEKNVGESLQTPATGSPSTSAAR